MNVIEMFITCVVSVSVGFSAHLKHFLLFSRTKIGRAQKSAKRLPFSFLRSPQFPRGQKAKNASNGRKAYGKAWYVGYADYCLEDVPTIKRRELFVLAANSTLVGTLISIGDLTRNIAILQLFMGKASALIFTVPWQNLRRKSVIEVSNEPLPIL